MPVIWHGSSVKTTEGGVNTEHMVTMPVIRNQIVYLEHMRDRNFFIDEYATKENERCHSTPRLKRY